jgi:hypothetical protein
VGDGEFAAMSQPASMTALPAAASDVARARGTLPALRSPAVLASAGLTYLTLLLAADHYASQAEQGVLGVVTAAVLLGALTLFPVEQRAQALGVVVFATIGEVTGSLVWGLYTYRLENVPMFVPPGHALMLMLGVALTGRMPERAARAILGGAGAYTIAAALYGLDTLAVPLYLLLMLSVLSLPAQARLFASSFVLTLALELYGTALGNWWWHREVPWLNLVTTNPPAIAGAFYCTLHALAIGTKKLLDSSRTTVVVA